MPPRKPRPASGGKNPDTTVLGRVTYPSGQDGNSASSPIKGLEIRSNLIPLEPQEPPPHTLRRSLFNQLEKQPDNPTFWILMGWSSPDARSAVSCFQHALDLEPENVLARDGLDWAFSELSPEDISDLLKPAPAQEGAVAQAPARAAAPPVSRPQASAPGHAARWRGRDFRLRTLTKFYYIPFFRNLAIAVIYLLLISAAEIITVLWNPLAGIIFHASLMIALIIHGSIIQQGPFRRYLVILAIAPLIRLLSLSLPLAMLDIPVMYRYLFVGIPLLLAVYFSARSVGLTANRLYFSLKGWPSQLLFSLLGFILGLCEFYILRPQALVPSASWFNIAMGIFILFVFTGFLEELIFRSMLQVTGIQLFGTTAIWIISILFGILHIGYFSAFDVLFATIVGMLFGYFALRTQSILGVSLAHGITNVTLYILLPLVLP